MSASSKKVIYAALIGNTAIALTKFSAAAVTGSSAMLSEGIHSLVDTGNQILLLYGMHRSRRPADEAFPFGHGKEVYFWSFVVAILVFALGAGISIYEGVQHLLHPHPSASPLVNYAVLGLAMIFEGGAWFLALREFSRAKGKWSYLAAVRRGKDPTIFVVLFEDSAALLGLVVAFLGILASQLTGIPHFDGAASIGIGLILAGTAIWLAYETKSLLIGESAHPEVQQGIRGIARTVDHVERVNEVLTMHMGPDFILVTMSVDFADQASAADVEKSTRALVAAVKRTYPQVKRVFVEAASSRSARTATAALQGPH